MSMENEELGRREFLKRAGVATAVVAGSAGFVALTSEAQARGAGEHGHGVVVGRSKKSEILYQKTPQWEAFYKSAL